jgi:predicted GH43/DUF377 family glycosyl hydrolase
MEVTCVLNPGVFSFAGKTWLILRVAERPKQRDGFVSFPIMNGNGKPHIVEFGTNDPDLDLSDARAVRYQGKTYLSTLSHLRLVCSDDGIHFYEPDDFPTQIFGHSALETFGIEDCRVSVVEGIYCLTFTQVSEHGVGVGLMRTRDWIQFQHDGMIIPPHNKDCAIFEEKINGKYYCLHRPSGVDFGGNYIWLASSPDLVHWGKHSCILHTRPGMWDCARVGAGAAPIKTDEGWLEIYHGADFEHRYCLGAVLLDLDDPSKVLVRSVEPLLEPVAEYEKTGFFGNVVFTNGHLVKGDDLTIYYGASDEVICGARFSIREILQKLKEENT